MKPFFAASFAALALVACATTPTYYAPAAGQAAVGYSEYRIEPGRYRVTFRGGPGARPELVADYTLLRAADLAIADGYDWFRVAGRYGSTSGYDRGPRMSVGAGGADYGYGSSFGLGVGTSFNLGPGPAYVETVEVVMGRGPRPEGADVYDARAVRQTIGQRANV
jgi:hypothetical protein